MLNIDDTNVEMKLNSHTRLRNVLFRSVSTCIDHTYHILWELKRTLKTRPDHLSSSPAQLLG